MPTTKNEEWEEIQKPSCESDKLEKKNASLSSRAMNALFCTLVKKNSYSLRLF